jgi:hypothetical protein
MPHNAQPADTRATIPLPTCLFIGPQKAGTSWIHQYLQERGDICLPKGVKETFFFDERFTRKDLAWYTSHFQVKAGCYHTIEVAPTYFQSQSAPLRIQQILGEIPIVVTLREPVARSFSLYLHMKRYGFTKLPLREAVAQHPEIIDGSRYQKHLTRWFDTFGRERVLVLFQEDLGRSPRAFAESIDQFLELPPPAVDFDYEQRVNEAATPRSGKLAKVMRQAGDVLRDYRLYWPIELAKGLGIKQFVYGHGSSKPIETLNNEDRAWLREQIGEDVEQLSALVHRDLRHWTVGASPAPLA